MSETYTPDNLIEGSFPVQSEAATMVSGAGAVVRGTVLGKITASGKLIAVNSAGTDDGRRTAYAVALEDVDATSDDIECAIALSGSFNENSLVFGGSDTITTHRSTMRALSMYAKPASAY